MVVDLLLLHRTISLNNVKEMPEIVINIICFFLFQFNLSYCRWHRYANTNCNVRCFKLRIVMLSITHVVTPTIPLLWNQAISSFQSYLSSIQFNWVGTGSFVDYPPKYYDKYSWRNYPISMIV